MVTDNEFILSKIPHKRPYRFIDNISEVNDMHISGSFFLDPSLDFYTGHFPGSNLTPGFVITEIMAQIGILGLGIFINMNKLDGINGAFLATSEIKFHAMSYSGDTIYVESKRIYFRFGKLKCSIQAFNQNRVLVCSGIFSGFTQ